jgi:uncharacterized radical SAM superfamily Fe-S cluster-containing enzyme
VPARIVEEAGLVWLEKECQVHGSERVIISRDPERFRSQRRYIRPAQLPKGRFGKEFKGCPDSCGLCPQHRQHTCLPVAEITSLCDMDCPICLKPKGQVFGLTPEEFRESLLKLKEYEGSLVLLNLSGGEPTCHPRFPEFIRIAAELGTAQITVSTNGLNLLKDKALRDLFIEYQAAASLQFDGLAEKPYQILRGRNLLRTKLDMIELFEKEELPYSLTAVAARGVNEDQIPLIADFFFRSRALSLMIQPAAVTGRAAFNFTGENRLTLDEAVSLLETSRHIAPGDLAPIACSHPQCAASAYYFKISEERFLSLQKFLGLEEYLKVTANRSFPGLDLEGHQVIKDRIYEHWAGLSGGPEDRELLDQVRKLLKRLEGREFSAGEAFEAGRETVKSVFVHGFMDPQTLDLNRLVKCCNHYLQAGGRLVPMCAHNAVHSADPGLPG